VDRFKEQTYRNDLIIGIEHEVGCLLTNIGVTTIFELLDRVYMWVAWPLTICSWSTGLIYKYQFRNYGVDCGPMIIYIYTHLICTSHTNIYANVYMQLKITNDNYIFAYIDIWHYDVYLHILTPWVKLQMLESANWPGSFESGAQASPVTNHFGVLHSLARFNQQLRLTSKVGCL
jgi:hypothetical protein